MVHCTLARMAAAATPEERRPKFRRIALIGKLPSAAIASSLRELSDYLRSRGSEVLVEQQTAQALGVQGADYETLGKGCDLAVVVGGDGAMLAAARNLVRHHVPVVGVNQGRLGFMTDIGHQDMKSGIGGMLDGKGKLEEGALLDAGTRRGGAAGRKENARGPGASRRRDPARRRRGAAHDRAQRGGARQGRRGAADRVRGLARRRVPLYAARRRRSEEQTSELQS